MLPLHWLAIPAAFVSLHDADPSILVEMRLAGPHNFIGRRMPGYDEPLCLLTRRAAAALRRVQADVRRRGYTLKVYDCYRHGQRLVSCTAPGGRRFGDNSIDMGTGIDCLDPLSHPFTGRVNGVQRRNRMLLRNAMAARGFVGIATEWWHFTLRNEPYPATYFDFPIRRSSFRRRGGSGELRASEEGTSPTAPRG